VMVLKFVPLILFFVSLDSITMSICIFPA
jgi:hypothetical protein